MKLSSWEFKLSISNQCRRNIRKLTSEHTAGRGNDSLFVFVEVTLDVNNQNSPLIIEDSVRFKTNGLDQYVKLAVWGQDAYFYYNDTVQGTWTSEKTSCYIWICIS